MLRVLCALLFYIFIRKYLGAFPNHWKTKTSEIIVNDKMQWNYGYLLTEPIGENLREDFDPELTSAEMLEMGIFGGKYMTDCRDEFPAY